MYILDVATLFDAVMNEVLCMFCSFLYVYFIEFVSLVLFLLCSDCMFVVLLLFRSCWCSFWALGESSESDSTHDHFHMSINFLSQQKMEYRNQL